LTARTHDRLIAIAAQHDISVSALVRRIVESKIKPQE